MSAYRDRPLACPRCRTDLVRHDARDVWACRRCSGALIGETELVEDLIAIAPELVTGAHDGVAMLDRRMTATLACPACAGDLSPVFLGGIDVDRCAADRLVWFDRGERDRVLDVARRQHGQRETGWFTRLVDALFGNGWAGQ